MVTTVPHRKQRYQTVGDWIPGRPVEIRVSRMKDERYVFLVALHELVEFELCRMKGTADEDVVNFDRDFEAERSAGLHGPRAEPGDDSRAPYRDEHRFATMIEKLVAQKLAVKWSDYEKTVMGLDSREKVALSPVATRRKAWRPSLQLSGSAFDWKSHGKTELRI